MSDFERLPLWIRLANAINSLVMYLFQTAVPLGLSPFYRHPIEGIHTAPAVVSCCLLLFATLAIFRFGTSGMKAGWLWFLGTLIPVIGLVQVGTAARADRYLYFPHIGLFIFLVAVPWYRLCPSKCVSWGRRLAICGCLLILSIFSWVSVQQCKLWNNSVALWSRALELDSMNFRAAGNLASAYFLAGNPPAALKAAQVAIRFLENVNDSNVNETLGTAYLQTGNLELACEYLGRAIQLNPRSPAAYTNLGVALRNADPKRSREMLEKAVEVDSRYPQGLANLANDDARSGDIDGAIRLYERAISYFPENKGLRENLELLRRIRTNL